jgi:hypothetical protein
MQNPYSSSTSHVDPNLVNAWGLVFNPQGFVWVANAGTRSRRSTTATACRSRWWWRFTERAGGEAEPTGIVFNASTSFQVTQNGVTGTSIFIFAGEGGTISGWSPNVTCHQRRPGGRPLGRRRDLQGPGARHPRRRRFHLRHRLPQRRRRRLRRQLRPGDLGRRRVHRSEPARRLRPFGIQAIGNQLFVTFAKQDANAEDDVAGDGLGALDVFDTAGVLVKRLIVPGGKLNAAWGMAMAPSDFGPFSNDLLVSNFGDGKINAFDPATGNFLGTLSRPSGSAIAIDGLWGIAFGNGLNSQPTNTLFFTGGPADEPMASTAASTTTTRSRRALPRGSADQVSEREQRQEQHPEHDRAPDQADDAAQVTELRRRARRRARGIGRLGRGAGGEGLGAVRGDPRGGAAPRLTPTAPAAAARITPSLSYFQRLASRRQQLTASSKLPTTAKPEAVSRAGTWSSRWNRRCESFIRVSLTAIAPSPLLNAQ